MGRVRLSSTGMAHLLLIAGIAMIATGLGLGIGWPAALIGGGVGAVVYSVVFVMEFDEPRRQ